MGRARAEQKAEHSKTKYTTMSRNHERETRPRLLPSTRVGLLADVPHLRHLESPAALRVASGVGDRVAPACT